MVQLIWRTIWYLLIKLDMYVPYDQAILLLGILPSSTPSYLPKSNENINTCTLLFIEVHNSQNA